MLKKNFYNIRPYDNLLVAEFFGSWDTAVTREYLDDALQIIRHHYWGKPYAVIDDCRKWELNTPDAIKYWKEFYTKQDFHFPTHVAYVVGNSTLKLGVIQSMIKNTESFKGAVFAEIREALEWLASHGYEINHISSEA